MEKEIWKDVSGYEGFYQVSSLGRIKTLSRIVKSRGGVRRVSERIRLGLSDKDGYLQLKLSKNNKNETKKVHQLVTIEFLNHTPCGHKLVVDHINKDRADNRVKNLRIITNRENTSYIRPDSSSKYTGVYFYSKDKTWRAAIRNKGKNIHIGTFRSEMDAHKAYQRKLKQINKDL